MAQLEVKDVGIWRPLVQPWAAQLCQEGVLHPLHAGHRNLKLRKVHRPDNLLLHLLHIAVHWSRWTLVVLLIGVGCAVGGHGNVALRCLGILFLGGPLLQLLQRRSLPVHLAQDDVLLHAKAGVSSG